MALTYFGLCDSTGAPTGATADNNGSQATLWNCNYPVSQGGALDFTCPGSGNQTLKEISAMLHVDSGSPNVRLAIYNEAASTKYAEGTAQVALSGTTDSWQGHLAQADITPNPCTLTGGTKYIIVFTLDAATTATTHASSNSTTYGVYGINDYTAGFPSSLTPYAAYRCWPVRAGVEAPSAGLSIPVAMAHYRQRIN